MNIEKIDSLKLANSIPSENDKTNMIAKLVCETADMQREIERLENIIKEVREKLLCYGESFDSKIHQEMQKEFLEILDKESEK